MSRVIKFRGKRIDNGEWVYGDLHKNSYFTKAHIHPIGERVRSFDIIPKTVGQFTGLLDSKGVEIYEGDRLIINTTIYEIAYYEYSGGWQLTANGKYCTTTFSASSFNCKKLEVIGNIHEKGETE